MNLQPQPAVSESTPFKYNSLRLQIPARAMSVINPTPDYFPLSPSSSDASQSNLDHITCLERSLCSDFFCCGTRLPDLHALLEHFEEDHVMILTPNGQRIFPLDGLRSRPHPKTQSVLTSPSPSSSRASSIAPSMSPCSSSSSTPSTPSGFSSPTSGPFAGNGGGKSNLTALQPVYTPFTPGLPVDPADPYLDADEIVMQHDPRIYGYSDENGYPVVPASPFVGEMEPPMMMMAAAMTQTPSSSICSDEDEEMSDSSTGTGHVRAHDIPTYAQDQVYATGQIRPIVAPAKHVKFAPVIGRPSSKSSLENQVHSSPSSSSLSSSATAASAPSSSARPHISKTKIKNRHSTTSGSSVLSPRRREKSFRCPTPRCTKSYLNPNGLKYHMEKGTCKIEGEVEHYATASASPPATIASPSTSVSRTHSTTTVNVLSPKPHTHTQAHTPKHKHMHQPNAYPPIMVRPLSHSVSGEEDIKVEIDTDVEMASPQDSELNVASASVNTATVFACASTSASASAYVSNARSSYGYLNSSAPTPGSLPAGESLRSGVDGDGDGDVEVEIVRCLDRPGQGQGLERQDGILEDHTASSGHAFEKEHLKSESTHPIAYDHKPLSSSSSSACSVDICAVSKSSSNSNPLPSPSVSAGNVNVDVTPCPSSASHLTPSHDQNHTKDATPMSVPPSLSSETTSTPTPHPRLHQHYRSQHPQQHPQHQQQPQPHQVVYQYPVPSYPLQGYPAFMHRSYYTSTPTPTPTPLSVSAAASASASASASVVQERTTAVVSGDQSGPVQVAPSPLLLFSPIGSVGSYRN